MAYESYKEHNALYQNSYDAAIIDIIGRSCRNKVAVIVHGSCDNTVVNTLLRKISLINTFFRCYAIDMINNNYNINLLLKSIKKIKKYSHILLLLSIFDINELLERVGNHDFSGITYITTGVSDSIYVRMTSRYPNFSLINIHGLSRNNEEIPLNKIINIMEADLISSRTDISIT